MSSVSRRVTTARTAALSLGAGQQEGVGEDTEVLFVGCLPVEIEVSEQEVRVLMLARSRSRCAPECFLLVESPLQRYAMQLPCVQSADAFKM